MKYYLDTEFNSFGGDLISLGLVREDGVGMYLVHPQLAAYTEWVAENVVPVLCNVPTHVGINLANWSDQRDSTVKLGPEGYYMPTTANYLQQFFAGDAAPHVIADWPDDIKYLCQELITGPGTMVDIPGITFEVVRVDAWPNDIPGAIQHNAYWDALALKLKCEQVAQ
jgi:hypothetical protein